VGREINRYMIFRSLGIGVWPLGLGLGIGKGLDR
jgi:hypothetical protein